jgi:hypothetical protein
VLDFVSDAREERWVGGEVVEGPEGGGGYVGEGGLDVEDVETGDVFLADAVLLASVDEGFEEAGCTVRVYLNMEILFDGVGAGQSTFVTRGSGDGWENID